MKKLITLTIISALMIISCSNEQPTVFIPSSDVEQPIVESDTVLPDSTKDESIEQDDSIIETDMEVSDEDVSLQDETGNDSDEILTDDDELEPIIYEGSDLSDEVLKAYNCVGSVSLSSYCPTFYYGENVSQHECIVFYFPCRYEFTKYNMYMENNIIYIEEGGVSGEIALEIHAIDWSRGRVLIKYKERYICSLTIKDNITHNLRDGIYLID
jgi:hypothetical protein